MLDVKCEMSRDYLDASDEFSVLTNKWSNREAFFANHPSRERERSAAASTFLISAFSSFPGALQRSNLTESLSERLNKIAGS